MPRMDPVATKIEGLQFINVKEKLKLKEGWTNARCERGEKDYRRFLYLVASNPGKTIVPWCEDLDIFWHYHILDTRTYARDCDAALGFFLHHNPNLAAGTEPHTAATASTHVLHKKAFNRSPEHTGQQPYPACGGCGSWFTLLPLGDSGSGHGEDSGSGASCAGSSCSSGASCSGSSCGSGCGGGCGGD